MPQNRNPETAERRLTLHRWLRRGWLLADCWLMPLPDLREAAALSLAAQSPVERRRRQRLRQQIQLRLELLEAAD